MQPSFEMRLASMTKALAETVLPAVDPANRAAVEQLQIVIGSLGLLREQIDYAHWFEVAEARGMAGLVETIIGKIGLDDGGAARDAAKRARDLADQTQIRLSTLREANVRLRTSISELIDIAATATRDGVYERVQELVLEHGKRQIDRERAFVSATHFDVFPETLLSIAGALDPNS